jgi:hypothetical protein
MQLANWKERKRLLTQAPKVKNEKVIAEVEILLVFVFVF